MATLARNMFVSGPVGVTLRPGIATQLRGMYRAVAADITAVKRVSITVEGTAQLIFPVGEDMFIRVTHPDEMFALTGDEVDRKWYIGVVDSETGEDISSKLYGKNTDAATIAKRVDALYRRVSK